MHLNEISQELARRVAKSRRLQSAHSTIKGLTSLKGDDVARHARDADKYMDKSHRASVYANKKTNESVDLDLEKRLQMLETGLKKAQRITSSIKYEPPALGILSQFDILVEEYGLDKKEFEYLASAVHQANNALQSTIYQLDDIFKDAINEIKYKIDDARWNDESL